MCSEEQLLLVMSDEANGRKQNRIVHMDSTSALMRKPSYVECGQLHYYSLVCRLLESIMPVAELITCQLDTKSLTTFLLQYRFFVLKVTGTWPFFHAIVVDWSWASMSEILYAWNKMEMIEYLDVAYEYLDLGRIPVNLVYLLSCVAHVLHRIANAIKQKYTNFMPIKNFLMDIVSVILLCRNMCELDALFEDFLRILLTKDKMKAENALPLFTERIAEKNPVINDLNEEVLLIEEAICEIEIEKEYQELYGKKEAVYAK